MIYHADEIKYMEKKFSVFRWIFLLIVVIEFLRPADHRLNTAYISILLAICFLYSAVVTIAAYSDNKFLLPLIKYTVYFDIFFISALLCTGEGLRSDIYIAYFIVIACGGLKNGLKGIIASLLQALLLFSLSVFFFTPSQHMDMNRYIARIIYITVYAFVIYEMNQLIHESREKEKTAMGLAYQDPLTGLPNRLALSDNFEKLSARYKKTQELFAIAMIDIDNFKTINDTKGHAQGDEMLVEVADILRSNVSGDDFACRFGGEEFIVLFADDKTAYVKTSEICRKIQERQFSAGSITISIGISIFDDKYSMIENISFADEALYEAKNRGKNQVVVYQNMKESKR